MASEAIPTELLERTTRAFDSNETKARRWLARAHTEFDRRPPVELARAESGRERVHQVPGRIDHGIYG